MNRRSLVWCDLSSAMRIVAVTLVWAVATVSPRAVRAQGGSPSQLGQRFRAAEQNLALKLDVWDLDRQAWEEIADSIIDPDRGGALSSVARVGSDLLITLRNSERDVLDALAELETIAAEYREELEEREEDLGVRFRELPVGAEADAIAIRRRAVQAELIEVNAILNGEREVQLDAAPRLVRQPRDTMDNLGAKALILQTRAEDNLVAIERLQAELEVLLARQREERASSDFERDLDRFGGRQTPTVGSIRGSRTDPIPIGSDTTQVERVPQTIEEQIEGVREIIEQLESDRAEFLRRADEFRRIVNRGTGS